VSLGGERREITVMFADVVGFTPLAERQRAQDVVTMLNELFTILTEIVFRHGGTVDKFVGDCVMAMWGAPQPQADHAARAVAAAEDMQAWLEAGNESWRERFGFEIELAIGINSGEAVVGNFGSEKRMDYTAIGDTVNVAARLESIARPGQILVTAATRNAVGDRATFVALGARGVIGRSQQLELFEVRS
jgi:adenylate cyclase